MPFPELAPSRLKQVLWSGFVSVRMWSKQPRVICSSLQWKRVRFHQAWCFQTYSLKKSNDATRRWDVRFPLFVLWSSQVFCLGLWSLLCSLMSINRFRSSQQNPRALEAASHHKTRKQSWENPFEISGRVFNNSVGRFLPTRHLIASAVRFLLLESRELFWRTQAWALSLTVEILAGFLLGTGGSDNARLAQASKRGKLEVLPSSQTAPSFIRELHYTSTNDSFLPRPEVADDYRVALHLKSCRRQLAQHLSGLYYPINLHFRKARERWGGKGFLVP